jgi:hypothetical protein
LERERDGAAGKREGKGEGGVDGKEERGKRKGFSPV